MNLFINPISKNCNIFLFNDKREIIDNIVFELKWNESSLLLPTINDFLKKNNIGYFDINNIVLVNGPWSFTWVRTAVLAINSINYIIKKNLTALSYFELFKDYPIIKSSSKKDCFFKKNEKDQIEIIENDKLKDILVKDKIEKIYWESDIENIEIIEKIDYLSIIKELKFQNLEKIEPLYLKKPNIC